MQIDITNVLFVALILMRHDNPDVCVPPIEYNTLEHYKMAIALAGQEQRAIMVIKYIRKVSGLSLIEGKAVYDACKNNTEIPTF